MMRSPLRYQSTDGDCFPTSVLNGLNWLVEFRRIPGVVLQHVYLYTLDGVGRGGSLGNSTTAEAGRLLAEWLNSYRTETFKVEVEYLEEEAVHLRPGSALLSCLARGGVAICDINLSRTTVHSILALQADKEWIYFWDPLPRARALRQGRHAERLPDDRGASPNLRIRRQWFDSKTPRPYSMGRNDDRTAVLIRALVPVRRAAA